MAIEFYRSNFNRLNSQELKKWENIPSAIVGDSLNRQNVMSQRLCPVNGIKMAGQALTVSVIAGDNGAIHAALRMINPTEILIIDGNNYKERAIWGAILNRIAINRNIGGVVIDGAVRDIEELRRMQLPVYFTSVTPAGPHKGWGGTIGAKISCGDISVSPGDLIIGDHDGVVVVPSERENLIFKKAIKRMKNEEEIISKIDAGEDLKGVFDYPEIEYQLTGRN